MVLPDGLATLDVEGPGALLSYRVSDDTINVEPIDTILSGLTPADPVAGDGVSGSVSLSSPKAEGDLTFEVDYCGP